MGTKQSKEVVGQSVATTNDSIGQFVLNQKQTLILKTVSDLLVNLLQTNNLFDLNDLLANKSECQTMILLLTKKLENEFTTLRFPGLGKDSLQTVSFVPEKMYKTFSSTDIERKNMCSKLVLFIVRLIALVSACVASVTIDTDVFTKLKSPSETIISTKTKNFEIRDLAISATSQQSFEALKITGKPMNYDTLELLSKHLNRVDYRSHLYFLGNDRLTEPIIFNSKNGAVYFGKKAKTSVFVLDITQTRFTERKVNPAGLTGQTRSNTLQLQNPQRLALTNGQTGQTGGRKTRRNRKQSGGNPNDIYFNVICYTTATEKKSEFIMNSSGELFIKEQFVQSVLEKSADSFEVRIRKILTNLLSDDVNIVSTTPMTEDDHSYKSINPDTIKDLFINNMIFSFTHMKAPKGIEVPTKIEGISPGYYRSYLLASDIKNGTIASLVCQDKWGNKNLTDIVGYSLLQTLYYDYDGDKMSNEATAECASVVDKYIVERLAKPNSVSAQSAQAFHNISFFTNNELNLDFFCKGTEQFFFKEIHNMQTIQEVKAAHMEIRALYNAQLESVLKIIHSILYLEDVGITETPRILLNPVFINHPKGAMVALEEIIANARKTISEYYIQVERIYNKTVRKFSK
jgi:hypothetical protein